MVKCSKCKYSDAVYDLVGDRWYVVCGVDGDIINEAIAEDDSKDCDFYVKYRDVNTAKKP